MTDTRDVTVDEARKLADDAQRIIGKLCSELRAPRMSAPVQPDDEDVRIVEAALALKNLAAQVERLTAERDAAIEERNELHVTLVDIGRLHADALARIAAVEYEATTLAAERDALREMLEWIYQNSDLEVLVCQRIEVLLGKERDHVG